MIKNWFVVCAVSLIFFALPLSVQANDILAAPAMPTDVPDQPSLADIYQQQLGEIKALKRDKEEMAREIQRLQAEIRQLNEILVNIRVQAGSDTPRPN